MNPKLQKSECINSERVQTRHLSTEKELKILKNLILKYRLAAQVQSAAILVLTFTILYLYD